MVGNAITSRGFVLIQSALKRVKMATGRLQNEVSRGQREGQENLRAQLRGRARIVLTVDFVDRFKAERDAVLLASAHAVELDVEQPLAHQLHDEPDSDTAHPIHQYIRPPFAETLMVDAYPVTLMPVTANGYQRTGWFDSASALQT